MSGSIYLGDGTASSGTLTTTKSGGFITSGGTWTVEAWIYPTGYPSVGSYYVGAIVSTVNASNQGWYFGIEGGTSSSYDTIELQNHNGTVGVYDSYNFQLNTWYHVAAVCVSGTIYFYVNGTVITPAGSGTFSFTESNTLKVGYRAGPSPNYYLPARVTNIRIVNGTAVYTGNFTPPITSLQPISGTQLLMKVLDDSSKLIDSSPNSLTISVNSGSPVYSALTPYPVNMKMYSNNSVWIKNLVEVDAQIPNLLQTSGLYQSNAASGPITITMPQTFSKNSTAIMTVVNYDSSGSNRIASINVGGTLANKDMDSGSTPTVSQIWRATNLIGGNTVVITYTGGTTNYISISVEEWDKTLYLDRSNTITTQSTSTPTLSTPGASIASKGVAYAVYNETSGTTVTSSAPPTGWTETWKFVGGTASMQGSGAYKAITSNAAVTATFTTGATSNYPEVMAVYALDTTNRYKFGAANNTLITADDPNWQSSSGSGFTTYGTITTDGLGRGKVGTNGDQPGRIYQAPATGPVEQSSQIWMYPRIGTGGIRGLLTQANSTSPGYILRTYDGLAASGGYIELYKANGTATYLAANSAVGINLAASYATVKMKTNILTKSIKVWVADTFVADAEVSGSLAIDYTDPGTALLGGYPGVYITDATSGNGTITNWTNFAPKYIVGNASPNFITATTQPQGGSGQTYPYGGLQWFTAGYVSPITGSANTAYISINSAAGVEIKVVVYDSSLSKVGEATFPNSLGTGLLSSKFDTPFSVVAGKTYYIAMSANPIYWGGYIGSGASYVCKGYELTATGVIPTTLPVGAASVGSPEMSVYFTVDPAISYSKLHANGTFVCSQFVEQA